MLHSLSSLFSLFASLFRTQSFSADVDLSFKYWNNLPKFYSFLEYCLYGALAFLAVVGGYKLSVFFLNKRRSKAVEIRGEDLVEILRVADRERSRFDMVIGNVKPIPCGLRDFDNEQMKLEAPSFIKLSRKFIGRDVRCFFRIRSVSRDKKKGDSFFFFAAPILDVEVRSDETKVITLSLPNLLSPGQKREYFRYSPPKSYVIDFSAWPEELESEKIVKLPPARCQLEGEGDFKGYVNNISAGGMLVELDRMYAVRSGLPLDVGKGWLIRLTLLGLNNDLLRVWFVGRLVNVLDTGVGKFQIAFRFSKYAWRTEEQAAFDWRSLTADGVPPIATWILKRSVEVRPQTGER